ncbi:hypothetical protein H5V45_18880 [Nocardioides sp. KIGAM211]|uniref:Uncharacterized protein n=1 Tax=Nocardioides luti TaxID=2761101 RepID=A0A7X0VDJ5_9ACTN|nr:hypothetical protein [Nocardioides luti]MBB6629398.1 hypothetical protein [Nocardioides luti]
MMRVPVVGALLGVLLGALLVLGGAAAPASASCAADVGPDGSDIVFVGVAQEERRGFTRFSVDQVWSGPDLAPTVWVLSGQEQGAFPLWLVQSSGSSDDASFEPGTAYVVGTSAPRFGTGACSSVEATPAELAAAPADAREPVAGGLTGADPPIGALATTGLVLGGVALLVLLRVLVWRRRARRLSELARG